MTEEAAPAAMTDLVVINKAPSEEYKAEAEKWHFWDSGKKKKFPYTYGADEKILMHEGSATLTPDDGSTPVVISAGDQVLIKKGFKCKWDITARIKKRYTVEQAEGEDEEEEGGEEEEAIKCDNCEADCFAESFFVAEEELDICPKCFKKARGADKKRYAGAEHQKQGEKWVDPEEGEPTKKKPKKR